MIFMVEDFTTYNEMKKEECLNCRYYIHYNNSTKGYCLLKHEEMSFDDVCRKHVEDGVLEMPKQDLEEILDIQNYIEKHNIGD